MKKQLIIIHGIRTESEDAWPTDLKWHLDHDKLFGRFVDVHVFRYEYINVLESMSFAKHSKIRREFQKFVADIREKSDGSISVIGHSFGTHTTMMSLLKGRVANRPHLDLIVLGGSIVDWDYPFDKVYDRFRKVILLRSTNDRSATHAPRPTFGRSGSRGFEIGRPYEPSKLQPSGVFNTEDLKISHMEMWRNQSTWFPYLCNMLKCELILKDQEIQATLEKEQNFLIWLLTKIGWRTNPYKV